MMRFVDDYNAIAKRIGITSGRFKALLEFSLENEGKRINIKDIEKFRRLGISNYAFTRSIMSLYIISSIEEKMKMGILFNLNLKDLDDEILLKLFQDGK